MATANIYDLADTWNDVGTTFTAIKMDVTNTASASGSLLMDLQVGSSSRFAITKDGDLSLGEDVAAPDTRTISAQSVIAGTTNTAGQNFTIQGSAGTGSGAGGSIIFQVAPAGGSGTGQNTLATALTIASNKEATFEQYIVSAAGGISLGANGLWQRSNGHLTLLNTAILGWSGGTNVNSDQPGDTRLYRDAAGTLALRNGANAQTFNIYNTFTDATNHERFSIIAQSGGAVQIGTNKGSVGGAARALELQTDGQTRLTITTSGVVNIGNNPFKVLGSFAVTSGYNSVLWSDGILGWGSGVVSETTTPDTCLQRDGAPDKLALKRGTNAQEFRVYKTTTGTVYKALLGDNNLIKISGEAFTDGAGADTGTLTNAPAAGNPTKWIPIDDNGTTRYIPAW